MKLYFPNFWNCSLDEVVGTKRKGFGTASIYEDIDKKNDVESKRKKLRTSNPYHETAEGLFLCFLPTSITMFYTKTGAWLRKCSVVENPLLVLNDSFDMI